MHSIVCYYECYACVIIVSSNLFPSLIFPISLQLEGVLRVKDISLKEGKGSNEYEREEALQLIVWYGFLKLQSQDMKSTVSAVTGSL